MNAQKGPGRPGYEATEEAHDKVKVLVAMGWEQQAIAAALGISLATLKRHFRANLGSRAVMRDRIEADRLATLYAQARAGRISAIRELGRLLGGEPGPAAPIGKTQQGQAAAERVAAQAGGRFASPAAPRLGKKEAAAQAALTAGQGTAWGDDLITPILEEDG